MQNKLTEHFTLDEFTDSDTAIRLGIDNLLIDAVIIENLKRTAIMAEAVRTILSDEAQHEVYMVVTSGYRSEALEKVICKKDYEAWCFRHNQKLSEDSWNSYFSTKAHPKGLAIDFRAPLFGTPFHIVRILQTHQELMGQIDQIILEGVTSTQEGWVHIGWSTHPRHQIRTAIFDKDGTPYYTEGLT